MAVVQPAKVYSGTGLYMAWGLKSLREANPLITGASAARNLRIAHVGDVRLAIDLKLHHLVWKASPIWPAVPEKSISIRLG